MSDLEVVIKKIKKKMSNVLASNSEYHYISDIRYDDYTKYINIIDSCLIEENIRSSK